MSKVDFVRHIVNPVLSKRIKDRGQLVGVVDEIRRLIIDAEEKYGFSVYGGDVVKLCDYLTSVDFKILVDIFKSADLMGVLVEIMDTARGEYSSIKRIVDCVDDALKNLVSRAVKNRGLVWFDCDGVLTDVKSSWGVLHKSFGSVDNSYFAELYRRGLITYLDWMKIDVALMIHSYGKEIAKMDVEKVFEKIKVKEDAYELIKNLKQMGILTGVVSSGVGLLVERVCRELGVDVCLYNDLVFANDVLIPGGVVRVPLRGKVDVIEEHSVKYGFKINETVYFGDSEWDLEVFEKVGLAIAVEPCGEICSRAHHKVDKLTDALPLIKSFYEKRL